jgi:hypothetical protein
MTTTIERTRPKLQKPAIREVCLVGNPARRYRHLIPKGPSTQDSGRSAAGKRGTD